MTRTHLFDAISYPGAPWKSTRTHHLLEFCSFVTGTGFGSTANTGGFGSTNTTGGGLFGGGSTGFGGSGGTSTMLSCAGTFSGLDVATLSRAFMSIEQHWLPHFSFSFTPIFCGSSNDWSWMVNEEH